MYPKLLGVAVGGMGGVCKIFMLLLLLSIT
ncbi:hypothetical protein IWQ47_002551 [Aquimarina sp. EL_43]|nr:hypothetical protein [Aquimarina sp. EL_35]MBG6151540.1 hypothetical protein [Aquimarina sp. EL_32]MBG6169471.1 hypothetical protein [Aquimarina sp. EL_43]